MPIRQFVPPPAATPPAATPPVPARPDHLTSTGAAPDTDPVDRSSASAAHGSVQGKGRIGTAGTGRRRKARPQRTGRFRRPWIDYPRSAKTGVRRWVPSWRQTLGVFLFTMGTLAGVIGYAYSQSEIPDDLNDFATQQDNVYYWADGTVMGRTGQVNRQVTALDRVPEDVRWAVLAAENASFYSDSGVSPSGMFRAVSRMLTGGETQGGSTITQQYVKNAYLNQDQKLSRKVTEMFIAIKLDKKMSKDDILEGYLNTSWFGRGTYGIQRAAYAYYRKDVSELTVSEGAFLATLLKGAGMYDPHLSEANHRRAVERWEWVLDRMVEIGKLPRDERKKITEFPEPKKTPKPAGLDGQTGYLVETARAYVAAHTEIEPADFDLGGYQIRTTFEKPKVEALATSVKKVRDELQPEQREADRQLHIGAASVEADGRIVALYGGPDYVKQGFNDANASNVPAGTVFTPFVYAAGLQDGVLKERGADRTPVTPATLYDGADKAAVTTPEGPYWDRGGKIVRARNDDGKSWGKVSLHQAMVNSVNTPLMQLGMDVGLDRVRHVATAAGLLPSSFGEQVPALSLGTAKPSAIRMASAYGTFAARGTHTDPYSVTRLIRNGDAVSLRTPSGKRALRTDVAEAVDGALQDSVRSGAASAAGEAGPGAAGKAGTAQDRTSAWFAGYRDQLATAVSISRPDPKTHELLPLDGVGGDPTAKTGSGYPLAIWTDYLRSSAR
ncbi:transglycosylase domain-containing protein [Streptomyces zagrosensis]|uniref:Membrane peptidoglycan carboxypeptidase n=1 Tax=Streptomyces zagrosensis TaxID=1042984 RepID=A0A7W9QAA7_9ACTN|nr:transglycosylase domain-containing protein [Streptomyces zagrosensis]MBB5936073.1 membrane peptidoglycan carboxypeptidase [Streptomyces zagrosensis]